VKKGYHLVKIHWKTGFVSQHQAERVKQWPHTTTSDVIDRIEQLYLKHTDQEVADILNKEGYRSGYGRRFTVHCVSHIRHRRGLKKYQSSKRKQRNKIIPDRGKTTALIH